MANTALNNQSFRPTGGMHIPHALKTEQDRLVSEAYAKGRADAFAYLGLDEKDFPQGDGVTNWTV